MSLRPRASDMAFDATRLEPGTRRYAIMVQGNRFGEMSMTLSTEGGNYVSRGEFAAGPMRVEQGVTFTSAFVPVSATATSPAGSLQLSNDGGRVTGSAEMQGQDPRSIDLTPPQGTLFPGMVDYAVEVSDEALRTHGPFGKTVPWTTLDDVQLRYFSTRRDRAKGRAQTVGQRRKVPIQRHARHPNALRKRRQNRYLHPPCGLWHDSCT